MQHPTSAISQVHDQQVPFRPISRDSRFTNQGQNQQKVNNFFYNQNYAASAEAGNRIPQRQIMQGQNPSSLGSHNFTERTD